MENVTKIEPVGATIDKLTILADVKGEFKKFIECIEFVGFELQDYKSKKYGYSYVYIHKEHAGYIEFARPEKAEDVQKLRKRKNKLWRLLQDYLADGINKSGMTITELNDELAEINERLTNLDERGHLTRLKDIRYEFNPKYIEMPLIQTPIAYAAVLSLLEKKNMTTSSVHIALDYTMNINDLRILDTKQRKEVMYRGKDKRIQSIYYGVKASRSHVNVYDKKTEAGEMGTIDPYPQYEEIVRFEARLKNNYARDFITSDFNPFEGLVISDQGLRALEADNTLSFDEYSKIFTLIQRPEKLQELPETTRKRWRKKINALSTFSIDVKEDYSKRKSSLAARLESILKLSSK